MSKALAKLDQMQSDRDEAVLERELRYLEAEKNLVLEMSFGPLVEASFGERVDMSDRYLTDGPGGTLEPLPSRADDRKDGDNQPFWQNEFELQRIRGIARFIATFNEIGIGAIDIMVKYVVGTGFEYGIEYERNPAAAKSVEAFVDEWDERTSFTGDLDAELKSRELRDGDFYAWIKPIGNGRSSIRIVEPDEITEPADAYRLEEHYNIPPGVSWKYGIATDPDDTSIIYGYYVNWNGQPGNEDFVPVEQMVHVKRNVDRRVKVGVSDFYAVWEDLCRSEKLLANMVQGASIQASIALIRNHETGVSKANIDSIQSALTRQVTASNSTQLVSDVKTGQIIDQSRCTTELGPMGTVAGANYELILQAAYRTIGSRWHMPEYMISGDASNGSFSSTLVAESPFVKTTEVEQSRTGRAYNRIRKIVARTGAAAGKIPGVTVEDIDAMSFTAVGANIASRERDKDITVDEKLVQMGAMSLETLAARNDLDYNDEQKKGAAGLAPTGATESLKLGEWLRRKRKGQDKGCSCGSDHDAGYM